MRCDNNVWFRVIGITLIAAGLIVLILSLPYWLWLSALGLLLCLVGFLLWRLG